MRILFVWIFILFTGCGERDTDSSIQSMDLKISAIQKIKKYCVSCHSRGNDHVFLSGESDLKNWEFISTKRNAKGVIWVEVVLDVLQWPSKEPPANYQKSESGRVFMPLGGKKDGIAEVNPKTELSDREAILSEINRMLRK